MRQVFVMAAILLMAASCRVKTVYVPVEKVVNETTEIYVHDTIIYNKLEYLIDSVVVKDTVSFLKNKYSTSYAAFSGGLLNHILKTDTSFIFENKVSVMEAKTVIRVTETKYSEVEKKLSKIQKLLIAIGYVVVGLVLSVAVMWFVKIILRLKK